MDTDLVKNTKRGNNKHDGFDVLFFESGVVGHLKTSKTGNWICESGFKYYPYTGR